MESLNDLIVDAFWIIRIIYLLGICMGMLQVHAKVSDCIRIVFCSNCIIEMAAALFLLYRGITVRGMGGWKGPARYCSWSYMAWRTTKTYCTNVCAIERIETCLIWNPGYPHISPGKKSLEDLDTVDGQFFAIYKYKDYKVHLKFIWPRFAQWHCHRSSPFCKPQLNVPPKGLSHHIRCQEVKEDYE